MSVFGRTQPVQQAPAPPPPPEPTPEELRRAAIAREGARPAAERIREQVQRREAQEQAQREYAAESERRRAKADYERRQRDQEMKAKAQKAWAERRDALQAKVAVLRSQLSETRGRADSAYAAGDTTAAAMAGALLPTIERALGQAESELNAHVASAPRFLAG